MTITQRQPDEIITANDINMYDYSSSDVKTRYNLETLEASRQAFFNENRGRHFLAAIQDDSHYIVHEGIIGEKVHQTNYLSGGALEKDFDWKEYNTEFSFDQLRTRIWVVPKGGYTSAEVPRIGDVYFWL